MSAFQGATNTTINGGTFTAVSSTVANLSTQNDIVTFLFSHSAAAGLLNAAERFDAPRCEEGTRISMLQEMKFFVPDGGSSSSSALYWLHGPAGVGKSAFAQSLSLLLRSEGDHAASFFFSRTSPGRNNGNQLILTLAYQLTINFPSLRYFMLKAVKKNPDIITSSHAVQMQSLIIDPINQWQKSYRSSIHRWGSKIFKTKLHPRLILVDGLDECNDPDVQRDIILCIAAAVSQLSLPFRFVLASRPESHILATFELDPVFQGLGGVKVTKKNLGDDEDVDMQITSFLWKQFAEIQRAHPVRAFLPQPWPTPSQVAEIVSKSSGGFIYPATVIRYISMPDNRPDECLQRILGMSPIPSRDKPYEPLDRLYRHIFESLPDTKKESVRDIFHFLVVPHAMDELITPRIIESHFNFKPGHVEHMLQDLLCIVALKTCDDPITILHASLPDFLLDRSRSGPLSIDIGDAHATVAASFHQLFLPGHRLQAAVFSTFLDHLIQANMTDNLLQALSELDLVVEYRAITAIQFSPDDRMRGGRGKTMPAGQYLRCITCLVAYLLVLTAKNVPTPKIMPPIHALETFIVQKYPCAATLQTIDNEMLKDIIPALRECVAIHPKFIATASKFDIFDIFHTETVNDVWRLYLLLMSPFFTSPGEYRRLILRGDARGQMMVPTRQYSGLACSLLAFLRSGTRESTLTSKSSLNWQGNELVQNLATQIMTVALAHSTYYAPLVAQLTAFVISAREPGRSHEDRLAKLFPQLSPSISAYCSRVHAEASMDQSQIKQLDNLITYNSADEPLKDVED